MFYINIFLALINTFCKRTSESPFACIVIGVSNMIIWLARGGWSLTSYVCLDYYYFLFRGPQRIMVEEESYILHARL
jgi:hypothetical protein